MSDEIETPPAFRPHGRHSAQVTTTHDHPS
jgi:hypothetical protein